jgi:hypothetical protein
VYQIGDESIFCIWNFHQIIYQFIWYIKM